MTNTKVEELLSCDTLKKLFARNWQKNMWLVKLELIANDSAKGLKARSKNMGLVELLTRS